MFGNIIEDAMFEVRRRWKVRVLVPLVIVFGFLLITGAVCVGIYVVSGQGRPDSVNSEEIPLGSYAAGNIEVFDCIYQGPDECSNYEKSQKWVAGSAADSLTYNPVKGDKNAPGEKVGTDGRRVSDFQALSEDEWHSLAAGVTHDGAANPSTVTENTVKTTGFEVKGASATAKFTTTGDKPVTGNMTFTLVDSGVVLKSITYTEAG